MAPSAVFEQLRKRTGFASAGTPAAPQVLSCPIYPGAFHYNRPEHFVNTETLSTGNMIPEEVTEGTDNSSTHTLGFGWGVTNSEGTTVWTPQGSGSVTDDSTDEASQTWSFARTIYNRVNYRDYRYTCPYPHLQRQPYNLYDILTSDGGPTKMVWLFNCGQHPKNGTWSTTTATSATIGGMSLGPINVSAQAGFGHSVRLHYTFNRAGEVCGNNPQGPLHSSIVEADQA
jgi:hypothetical protein